MKIECILMREGGTFAEIGGVTYHFALSAEHGGRHVATVDNPVHAARFMSIPEGYRPLPGSEPAAVPVESPDAAAAHAEAERLATEQAAAIEAQQRKAEEAHRAAVAAAEDALLAAAAKALTDAPPPAEQPAQPAPDLATMTREEMVDLHDARFGRKPHHRLSDDKLRDLLAQPATED